MTGSRRRSRGAASSPKGRARASIVSLLTLALLTLFGAAEVAAQEPEDSSLFGVVGFYNPRLLYLKYQPLVDYLSETTGRSWELKIYTTYDDTVDDLCEGRLSAAYLGPLTYVRAHEQCAAVPVVRLNTGDSATIQSFIMVRNDSPITKLEELDGKRFGFGSPLSTTSHLAPRSMLKDAGLEPGANIDCHYFEHHEKAARAVLLGQVDACGVRDIVGSRFESRGMRIIARSAPIENFPIVVSPGLAESVGVEILEALFEAPKSNATLARRMLSWDPEISSGFRPVEDKDYDGVRELAFRVLGDEALTMSAERTRCASGRSWRG